MNTEEWWVLEKFHWIQSLKMNQSLFNSLIQNHYDLKWLKDKLYLFRQVSCRVSHKLTKWACAVTPKKIIDSISFYLYYLRYLKKRERQNFGKPLSSTRGLTKLKMILMRSIQILGLSVFTVYNEMCQHMKDLHNSLSPSG